MHELPVTESIFKITIEQVKKNQAKKVNSIRIKMGEGCDFVPQIIEEYFQIFAENTPAAGAKIIADIVPTKIKCMSCGAEHKKDLYMYTCPICGSERLRPLISNDLTVENIEMEF